MSRKTRNFQSISLDNASESSHSIPFEPWAFTLDLMPGEIYELHFECASTAKSHGITFRNRSVVLAPIDADFTELRRNGELVFDFR